MNLYDLALCTDYNDNDMTFVAHIVFLCPSKHHLHYRSARAQIMLLGLQLNYKPSESHVIALFASLQENKWADKCMNILDSQC